jgi:hypothetical protein
MLLWDIDLDNTIIKHLAKAALELYNKQTKEVMLHEKHEAARKIELEHLINHAVKTVHPKLHFSHIYRRLYEY